ncbi:hypothetical protein GCM10010358_14420 [Streptomyces minutiscleroticus]|uniref:Uncharacterized protein n=1 Tax=Streptomyces minutiscleroticus TaxID=68238 RepID=A0A918KH67_9ACTN|nr:hypothetical protein GCM10010358_14420 [Streptomyces minutiscleroticus]
MAGSGFRRLPGSGKEGGPESDRRFAAGPRLATLPLEEPLPGSGSTEGPAVTGRCGAARTGSGCDVRCVWTRDTAGTGSESANGAGPACEGAAVLLLVLRVDRAETHSP